jgi:hypothetical protein
VISRIVAGYPQSRLDELLPWAYPTHPPSSLRLKNITPLTNDPAFAEKVEDIVGLSMSPPAHAVVLSIDRRKKPNPGTQPDPAGSISGAGCANLPRK